PGGDGGRPDLAQGADADLAQRRETPAAVARRVARLLDVARCAPGRLADRVESGTGDVRLAEIGNAVLRPLQIAEEGAGILEHQLYANLGKRHRGDTRQTVVGTSEVLTAVRRWFGCRLSVVRVGQDGLDLQLAAVDGEAERLM